MLELTCDEGEAVRVAISFLGECLNCERLGESCSNPDGIGAWSTCVFARERKAQGAFNLGLVDATK
jgi:hypothetical protein